MKPTLKDVDAILNSKPDAPPPEVKPPMKTAEDVSSWRDIPFSGDLSDWLKKDTFEHFDETLAEWRSIL